jgi:sugar diacid utilization regulator
MMVTMDDLLTRREISSVVAPAEEDYLLIVVRREPDETGILAADLKRELQAYHQVDVRAIGVSQSRRASEGLKASYEEARLAAELGPSGPNDVVTSYASLGALRLLNEIPLPALESHLRTTLGVDLKFHDQFRVTYGALVQHDYNKAAAARALYIHVNTLKYRLARIKRSTGLDPSDSDGRFALECTLRLLYLQEIRSRC